MNPTLLETYKLRLQCQIPLIGPWLRQKAIKEFTQDGSLEAVETLIEAVEQAPELQTRQMARSALEITAFSARTLFGRLLSNLKLGRTEMAIKGGAEISSLLLRVSEHPDPGLAGQANCCLRRLSNPKGIDFVCAQWARRRDDALSQIIKDGGYIANEPLLLRVLTALKVGQMAIVNDGGKEIVQPLLEACSDGDPEVAVKAQRALLHLNKTEAQGELCRIAIVKNQPAAMKAVLESKYFPQDLQERAVFYFLTEQWEKYESLDFDHMLLRTAYEAGDEPQRRWIAEQARRTGRIEWMQIVPGGRQGLRLGEMKDAEWETVWTVLKDKEKWEELWQLALEAPPKWSRLILLRLVNYGWGTFIGAHRTEFAELIRLAAQCKESSDFLRELVQVPQELEAPYLNWVFNPLDPLDLERKQHKVFLRRIKRKSTMVISQDGEILIWASKDHTVRVWSLPEGKPLMTLPNPIGEVCDLAISPDGRFLISKGEKGNLCLWDLFDGIVLKTIPSGNCSIVFSQDGRLLVCGEDKTVRLWSLPEGRPLGTLEGHTKSVTALAISPDGQMLVSGSEDHTVRLWSLPEGKPLNTLFGHTNMVKFLAISPDGKVLISSSLFREVRLWGLQEGIALATLKGYTDSIAISHDGKMLIRGCHGGTVELWSLLERKVLATLEVPKKSVDVVVTSSDGGLLISGSKDGTVHFWDLLNRKFLATLEDHNAGVKALALGFKERILASESEDGTVWLSHLGTFRLSCLPVGQMSFEDLGWVEKRLGIKRLSETERSWLEFILALLRLRRRFDIQLESAPRRIEVGEFDIEIDR